MVINLRSKLIITAEYQYRASFRIEALCERVNIEKNNLSARSQM